MKKVIVYTFLALSNFAINFLIYNHSFNRQATPYLSEGQRMDSGMLMLQTTIPAYLFASVVFAGLVYFASRKMR